jgi:hypothetical protein
VYVIGIFFHSQDLHITNFIITASLQEFRV